MTRKPTAAQGRVLAAIETRLEHGEPPPTYRDLCRELGWSSTGTVRDHLRALADQGFVELSGRRHRQIRLRQGRTAVSHIPLVGEVVAGVPVLAEEKIEGRLPVPKEWTRRGVFFALRVVGDSMIDAGIVEGDYVVVRQQPSAEDGEVVVVAIEGETTVKRLRRKGRVSTLVAENPRYRPIRVRTDAAVIQGVVVGLLRSYGGQDTTGRGSRRGILPRRRGAGRA